MFRRISPCDAPCCLRPKTGGSAFGFCPFEAIWVYCITARRLAHHPCRWLRQWASGFSVSFLPAIQATGLGLLPRWDLLPLIMPAFAGCTRFVTNVRTKAASSIFADSCGALWFILRIPVEQRRDLALKLLAYRTWATPTPKNDPTVSQHLTGSSRLVSPGLRTTKLAES